MKFFGLDLNTTKETFIPRPETELLVDVCLKTMSQTPNVLDLGTGTGNIAISLTILRHDLPYVCPLDNQ